MTIVIGVDLAQQALVPPSLGHQRLAAAVRVRLELDIDHSAAIGRLANAIRGRNRWPCFSVCLGLGRHGPRRNAIVNQPLGYVLSTPA